MTIDTNDPRWTALALGELEGSERAEFEALTASDPDAARRLEEIRAAARLLADAFHTEEAPSLSSFQRQQIEARLARPAVAWRPRVLRWSAGIVSIAAAVAVVGLTMDRWRTMPPQVRLEMARDEDARRREAVELQAAQDPSAVAPDAATAVTAPAPRSGSELRDAKGLEMDVALADGISPAASDSRVTDLSSRTDRAFVAPLDSSRRGGVEGGRPLAGARGPSTNAPANRVESHGSERARRSTSTTDAFMDAEGLGESKTPRGLARTPGQSSAPASTETATPTPSQSAPAAYSLSEDFRESTKSGAQMLAKKEPGQSVAGVAAGTEAHLYAKMAPPQAAGAGGGGLGDTQNRFAQAGGGVPSPTPSRPPVGAMGRMGNMAGEPALPGAPATRSKFYFGGESQVRQQGVPGLTPGQKSPTSPPADKPSALALGMSPELDQLRRAGKQGQSEEAGVKEKLAEIEARKAIRSTETLAQKIDADRLETAPAPAKPDVPPVVAARGDVFVQVNDNAFIDITDKDAESRRSTFSIDVDTASYTYLRKGLQQGVWPPPDAVRIEELVNFFTYDDPTPKGADPLAIHVEVADCPWNRDHALARIALRAKPIDLAKRPPSNLVFLVDVSGSMDQPDKLPLVKAAMRMLARELGENDKIAVVVYAGNAGLVLEPTRGHRRAEVASAIDQLEAGGSTNGGEGISLAYDLAAKNFISNGTNRVILATDGDFNVGVTDRGDLVKLIEEKSKTGVFLNVLGVGQGNLKDATMEQLADKGNGVYAYLDTLEEAKRVLVDQIGSTLVTVAKDVKIQVDFNPTRVKSYRQIGYENRHLANEDFANDAKDAGEIGAGHSVTALYELELPPLDDKLAIATKKGEDLFTVRVRYKEPTGSTSKLMERPVGDFPRPFADASVDYRFSASVAAFGMILRHSPHKGTATLDGVLETAGAAIGPDKAGYRKEFLDLVRRAKEVEPKPEVAGEAAPR